METGFRMDADTGEAIPAHFINQITIKHENNIVLSCDWSRAVSKNPYLAFRFKGAKPGDKLELAWTDNLNNNDSINTLIE